MYDYGYTTEPAHGKLYCLAGDIPHVDVEEFGMAAFKARNPLIDVVARGSEPILGDKVSDGKKMDAAAYRAAVRILVGTKLRQASVCEAPDDLNDHSAWLQDLSLLTKPFRKSPTSDKNDEALEDMFIWPKVAKVALDRSLVPDFKVQAYDPKAALIVNVLSIVCNDTPSDGLYRAADGISRSDAVLNLDAGRRSPIFVQQWGRHVWTYGILFPECVANESDPRVQVMLKEREELATELSGMPFKYQGWYVKGTLVVDLEPRSMPRLSEVAGVGTNDFLHSLMRIVVGDQVLSWDANTVMQIVQQRQNLLAKIKEYHFKHFRGPPLDMETNVCERRLLGDDVAPGVVPDVSVEEFGVAALEARNPLINVVKRGRQRILGDKVSDGKTMDPDAYREAAKILIDTKLHQAFAFKLDILNELDGLLMRHLPWLLDLSLLAEQNFTILPKTGNVESLVPDLKVQRGGITLLSVVCGLKPYDSASYLYKAADGISRTDAIKNIQAGCRSPIFVQHWGKFDWTYGVFFPERVVCVEDSEQESSVQLMLEKRTQLARELSGAAFEYRGMYVKGTLMVDFEPRSFPQVPVPGVGGFGYNEFLHSLMRIVIGDQVLNWDADTVARTVQARQRKLEDFYLKGPGDHNLEETDEYDVDRSMCKRTKTSNR